MDKKHPIDRAADMLGGVWKLAEALNVSAQAICNWKRSDRGVPFERCLEIEDVTDRAVTRRDLRPADWKKLWPEMPELPKRRKGDKAEAA